MAVMLSIRGVDMSYENLKSTVLFILDKIDPGQTEYFGIRQEVMADNYDARQLKNFEKSLEKKLNKE